MRCSFGVIEIAAHPHADLVDTGAGRRHGARQAPAGQHRDAVAHHEQLLHFFRHHQHRGALVAQVDDGLADQHGRADVDAPRRLRHHHHFRRQRDLAPDDEFLQVAAGKAGGDRLRAAALDLEALDHPGGELAHRAAPNHAAPDHAAAGAGDVAGQQRVVGQRQVGHCAAPEPLFRHETETELAPAGGIEPAGILPEQADGARRSTRQLARNRFQQLLLAIAGDPGDADDLAAAQRQLDVFQVGAERIGAGHRQMLDRQQHLAGRARRQLAGRQLAADHQFGQRARAFLARVGGARHATATQHGGLVAQRLDLIELVADVQDADAVGGEPAQRLEQLLHRVGREHRGRLVHDQQAWRLQQAAHDLDALAFADRHAVHQALRIERQPVLLGDGADARRQLRRRDLVVERQRDVFGHGQCLEQREMLEYHADPQLARRRRRMDLHLPAFPDDLARVGPRDAVDHLHQRALAGAVLAQHRVDLAWHHRQVDRVVSHHRRVDLGNARQPQARLSGGGKLGVGHRHYSAISQIKITQ
jgi:hypothetical protein